MASSEQDWVQLFALFGVQLTPIKTGCCGMAGGFGHQMSNQSVSKKLFEMSWKDKLSENALITGFSCACQAKRLMQIDVVHPTYVLHDAVK